MHCAWVGMRETLPSTGVPSDGGPFGGGPGNWSVCDKSGAVQKGPGSLSRGA